MSSTFIGVGIFVFVVVLTIIFIASRYKKVDHEGEAIVVNGIKESVATFTGAFVWPIVNSFSRVDVTKKKISVLRIGKKGEDSKEEYQGLHCKDNIRANLKVDFYIGINHDPKDVIMVAKTFTAKGASDLSVLEEHFKPKFSEALKTTCKQFDFVDLFHQRIEFRDAVRNTIEKDMDGFKIYDVVIDQLDQTALEAHDPNNVQDAAGILKITQITSDSNVQTNQVSQDKQTKIVETNGLAEAQRLQLMQAEELARFAQKREVDTAKAREETLTIEETEKYKLKQKAAAIKTEQEAAILEEASKMEIETAQVNNDGKIEVQKEDMRRKTAVETMRTEKELAEEEVQKNLVIENGAKKVADSKSQRVQIERKIASEEEETLNLRAKESSNRDKLIKITASEAEAEAEQTSLTIKAKAEKLAAESIAEKVKIESDTAFYRSEQEAKSIKIKADAHKSELESVGLAEVEIANRKAETIEKVGKAEAVKIREIGAATAESKELELKAAESGTEKGLEYAKWLHTQNINERISIKKIESERDTSVENAKALGIAISNADIKLYGGEGLDQIRNSIMNSVNLDAKINNSEHLNRAFDRYQGNEENLINDIKDIAMKSEISTGDLANMSIAKLVQENPQFLTNLVNHLKK